MKILVATTFEQIAGGVETYLRAVLPALRARGHEVGLFAEHRAPAGAPVIQSGCAGLRLFDTPDQAVEWNPCVCYLHGLWDVEIQSRLLARVPTVYYAHNYVGTCVSGSKCQMSPAPRPCHRRLGVTCLGLYLPKRCGGLNPVTALKQYRLNTRQRSLFANYRAVLVASQHMADEVVNNGAPPGRVQCVPLFTPGVLPDPVAPAPKSRTDRILFVGRVTGLKGWRELLSAVPLAAHTLGHPLTLVVAGDGPDLGRFETEARTRGVTAEFLGWVDAERREAEMRNADLLAVPSVWPEPFGLVGIEAGCVGLPAAAFRVGGIPDWLVPGATGELAPGDRPTAEGLADAIVRALADDTHWQRLRIGAWEKSREFSVERHMNQLLPLLAQAANT